jgi:guanine deaminase
MKIFKGRIFSFLRKPDDINDTGSYIYLEKGAVVCDDKGVIVEVNDYSKLNKKYKSAKTEDFGSKIICPGFIDLHNHFPQTQVIASYGTKLLEWLNKYTFPNESLFFDKNHCERESKMFLDLLNSNGITTSVSFGSVHTSSVEYLFREAHNRNMCLIAGNVLMDRHAPDTVLEKADKSYLNSKEIISRWHNVSRCKYAITPRFAITSTPELLEVSQSLYAEHNSCYVQTHLSENIDEIKTTLNLFPDYNNYLAIYDKYKLLSNKTLLAHSIHLEKNEIERIKETKSVAVHCPTSNLFLGSGLFKYRELEEKGVRTAIATDVGGGTSFSMLRTLDEAYKIQQLENYSLNPLASYFWSTMGNDECLGLQNQIGSIKAGSYADLIVLNSESTSLMRHRMEKCRTIEEELFILQTLGDDRAIDAVFISGKKIK